MSIPAKAISYLTELNHLNTKEKEKLKAEKQFKKTIKKIDKDILKRVKEERDILHVVFYNDYLMEKVRVYYNDLGYATWDYTNVWGESELVICWNKDLIDTGHHQAHCRIVHR